MLKYTIIIMCPVLVNLKLPSGLVKIGSYALRGCTSLTGPGLPDPLVTLDESAFIDCTGLTAVHT